MKKSTIFKLLIVLLTLSALFVLFAACDKGNEGDNGGSQPGGEESGTEIESIDGSNETEDTGNVESDSETESTESGNNTETETETETKCEHPYDAKQEGHWKPACSVCGKPEGKVQDHQYVEYQEDEGDLIYYSYVCTVCGFEGYGQEVPYEINLFFPASEIANLSASGGVSGTYFFESGLGYGRFSREEGAAGATATVTIEDSGTSEDDPTGQYMAIKVRLPRSQTSLTLNLCSVNADKPYSLKLTDVKPGWITLVIDLSKVVKTNTESNGTVTNLGYKPDQYDEFYLKSFTVSTYVGKDESFDISYVVFCENMDDIMDFVEGENNYYIYHDALLEAPEKHTTNCEHNYIIDHEKGTHTLENPCFICGTSEVYDQEHTFVEISGNGKNSFECSICAYAKYFKVVPEEVNKYYSASQLNAGGIIYYPYTLFEHGMYVETGDAYTRYEGPTGINGATGKYFNVGQVIYARDDKDFNGKNGTAENGIRINVGDATYFVLRVRVNTDNLSPLSITISTTEHDGKVPGNSNFKIPVASTPKDTWNTYVINLAEVFPDKYLPDDNGDYIIDTYYFNICEGTFAPGCTLDLSYMAYCSSWDEVAELVDEEELFYLSDSMGGGNWVDTIDRGCSRGHTPGEASITENGNKITYEFKCSICGQPASTKTIDSSVSRYYYPGEISSSAKTYFQLNGVQSGKGALNVYDADAEFVFSRFTGFKDADAEAGTSPVTGQAIWQRNQADAWNGQTFSDGEQYTENVGDAEWLVLRVRSSSKAQSVEIVFSTTAHNAAEGNALGRNFGGMTSLKIPFGAAEEGEWATYVVNLKNVDPEVYRKDADLDDYVIDSFYINFPAFPKSETVDIEYMAFVDGSWAELDALVEEETVVVIADRTGGYGLATVADGKCVEGHHSYGYSTVSGADGSVTNTVECALCGSVLSEQKVSAEINKFFDITAIGCFKQVNTTDPTSNHSDARMLSPMIDIESGTRFVRCEATFGNAHINLNGGDAGGKLSDYTIDTGRYAVLKFRANGRGFAFDAQTGDFNTHANTVYNEDEANFGVWQVFVIDLSALGSGTNTSGSTFGYTVDSEQQIKFRLTTTGTDRDADGWYINDPYTIDIAYFAVVDDLDEARSIITDDTYILFENGIAEGGAVKNTADGSDYVAP